MRNAPSTPQVPNLLVAYSTLGLLGRAPPYADRLWRAVHVREGRVVRTSALFLHRFGEAFERLGLAEVARSEIDRYATADAPPGAIYLRYHAVALFEHLGRLLVTLGAFVRDHFEVDSIFGAEAPLTSEALLEQLEIFTPALATVLSRKRPGLLRIERLALEATRPGALRIAPAETASRTPASDPIEEAEISPLGVGRGESPRREWLAIPELATTLIDDASAVTEAVARAAVARIQAGGRPDLDVTIELG